MKIQKLYDNATRNRSFSSGWGISYLIDDKLLFDTGDRGEAMLENMKTAHANVSGLETVVISHDHWDHTGGLWGILRKNHKLKIYACPNFSKNFKALVKSRGGELAEAERFTEIKENIYTTGEIMGRYGGADMPEQALALKTDNGITIITGCAHPGIVNIVENVKENMAGGIYLVMGGFHLMDKFEKDIKGVIDKFKKSGVKNVSPCHCTGKNAVSLFKKIYGSGFIDIDIGESIEV